jgi:glutaredoxin
MANDEKVITEWAASIERARPVKVRLTGDSRSERFRSFAERLAALAPALRVRIEEGDEDQPPELVIPPNFTYRAVPAGHELSPFLQILADTAGAAGANQFSDTRVLEKLAMPAVIKVYVTPECPFCPQTVESLAALAGRQEMVHLVVIDGSLFSEHAEADRVSSVPTVLLDDQFRWTGSIQLPELIDIMLNRDPAQLSSETLKQILYDGKAADLARMMADSEKVFPGLYALLTHPLWPVRLGAMVTVEYLAAMRSDLTAEVVEELWRQFDDLEDPVKGDILYLFGETAPANARAKLESVVQGEYPNMVKEAAADALTAL